MELGLRTLILSMMALAVIALTPLAGHASGMNGGWSGQKERTLSFYNTHTNEALTIAYWRNDRYDNNALRRINTYLRDHRNGHEHVMSHELMNLLHSIKLELQRRHPGQAVVFHVISGYRSSESNEMLRAGGGGQAKNSRHMQGDAIDIRVPGVETAEIRDIAWCMQRGGVGYYKGSDFVHVDTHKVRFWNWKPTASTCPQNGRGDS